MRARAHQAVELLLSCGAKVDISGEHGTAMDVMERELYGESKSLMNEVFENQLVRVVASKQ